MGSPAPSSTATSVRNYVASVTAGVVSILAFNNLDTLRVRFQCASLNPANPHRQASGYLAHVVRTEGFWRGLHRPGLLANVLAVGSSTGLRLGMYPFVRETLGRGRAVKDMSPSLLFVSGLVCGSLSYFITTPLWGVKTKIQGAIGADPSKAQPKIAHLLVRGYQTSGLTGLWRGAAPLVVRGGLLTGGQFLGYDFTKSRLVHTGHANSPALHLVCSGVSALTATLLATPADVLLSRYVNSSLSLYACAAQVAHERAFFRGFTIFFSRMLPTFSLAMPVYEQVRALLGLGYL